jgi:hypothetical protein
VRKSRLYSSSRSVEPRASHRASDEHKMSIAPKEIPTDFHPCVGKNGIHGTMYPSLSITRFRLTVAWNRLCLTLPADFAIRVACRVLRLDYSISRITSKGQVSWVLRTLHAHTACYTLPPRAAHGGCSALVTLNLCAATICRQHGTG